MTWTETKTWAEKAADPAIDIEFLSTEELLSLPPVRWLMQGLIPESGLIGLVGQPGEGKSFIALDWAMTISEGLPWLGIYATKQAPVVYIAAEGGRGIQKRVNAWMRHHGVRDLPAMYWLLNPLYVREPGTVEAFLDELEHQDVYPGLTVIDTLSRCFGAGEENASSDMGGFVDAATRLVAGRQMSVMIVHHMNATGKRERGHTSFKAGLETMHICRAEKNGDNRIIRLSLENDKQKDDVQGAPIYVQPIESVKESLVFEVANPPEKRKRGTGEPTPMRRADMLTFLRGHPEGLTYEGWILGTGVPASTFKRSLAAYKKNNDVYTDGGRYFATPTNTDIANAAQGEME